MADAHDHVARFAFGAAAGLTLLVAPVAGCHMGEPRMNESADAQRAAELAKSFAAHAGAADRALGPDGDLSLGETGLQYDARANILYGRVWINIARIKNAPPERLEAYRKMLAALNDPHIGGMYEQAGGYFVLDPQREGFFLVRKFPVSKTTQATLQRDMERLQTVAAKWSTTWFLDVAMIMHGKEPAPVQQIHLP